MNVLKICGIVLIFLIFTILLPKNKGNISVVVGIALCIMILLSGIENIIPVFDYAKELSEEYPLLGKYSPVLFKTLGVGLVCSAVSGICRENGEAFVGDCVELFGKGQIMVLALPLVKELFSLALEA